MVWFVLQVLQELGELLGGDGAPHGHIRRVEGQGGTMWQVSGKHSRPVRWAVIARVGGVEGASWDLLHPELKGQVPVEWKWDERGREANASLPPPPS